MSLKRLFEIFLICLLPLCARAEMGIKIITPYDTKAFDKTIEAVYKNPASHSKNESTRIEYDSSFFLGKPYILFPTGEGAFSAFDKNPLYRTDAFDCMTYVISVIALAKSNNLAEFQKNWIKWMYEKGQVSFLHRNHFSAGDFNRVNPVKNISAQIKDEQGNSVAKTLSFTLDKPKWFANLPTHRLQQFKELNFQDSYDLVRKFHSQYRYAKKTPTTVVYIPLQSFYLPNGEANEKLFAQIPNTAIIEIYDPSLKRFGQVTDNIAHLGFAIRKGNELIFREASSDYGEVIDVPMQKYMQAFLERSPKAGISILILQ